MEKTILEKNEELKRLKMITGKTQQILAHLQAKLKLKTDSVSGLKDEITQKKKLLETTKDEIEKALRQKEFQ
jgi:Domain of unknown function (DUF4201)